jgi:TPR repeat protein
MAISWMTKAAEQGDAEHQAWLGLWLFDGMLIEQSHPDPVRAIPWLEKAAAQGEGRAMYMLGRAYDRGKGVPESPAEAARWYQQALDQGNKGVAGDLAKLYEMGRGVPQDDHRAFTLYLDSARGRSASSAQTVAEFYRDGRGVKKDPVEAYAWYTVFAVISDAGDEIKVGPRNAMAGVLKLNEIAEGQRRAAELFRPHDGMHFLSDAEASITSDNIIRLMNAGEMFLKGTVIPQSFQKAFQIFQKLADAGYPEGLVRLGEMYEAGLGMEPDLVEACMLYYVARDRLGTRYDEFQVDPEGHLLRLKPKMSEDLRDHAQKRALKWQPKAP